MEFISKYNIDDYVKVRGCFNSTYIMKIKGITFILINDEIETFYFSDYEEDLVSEFDILCKTIKEKNNDKK